LNHPVDLLFCLDDEQNMYVIPIAKIRAAGNNTSITLSTKARPQGLNTAEYLVKI